MTRNRPPTSRPRWRGSGRPSRSRSPPPAASPSGSRRAVARSPAGGDRGFARRISKAGALLRLSRPRRTRRPAPGRCRRRGRLPRAGGTIYGAADVKDLAEVAGHGTVVQIVSITSRMCRHHRLRASVKARAFIAARTRFQRRRRDGSFRHRGNGIAAPPWPSRTASTRARPGGAAARIPSRLQNRPPFEELSESPGILRENRPPPQTVRPHRQVSNWQTWSPPPRHFCFPTG